MFSITLWITCLLLLWIYILWSRRRYYKLIFKLPGPLGLPLIGILYRCLGNKALLKVLGDELEKCGSVVFSWFHVLPLLVLSDPQLTQEVLPIVHNKGHMAYNVMEKVVGNGLVVLKETPWTQHRKILNPALTTNVLIHFIPVFNNESEHLIQQLDSFVNKGEQDLFPLIKNFTIGISTQTTWGLDFKNDHSYKDYTIMQSYETLLGVGTKMFISPWLNNKLLLYLFGVEKALNTVNTIIRGKIKQCIVSRLNTEVEPIDDKQKKIFANVLIDQHDKKVFSYQDIEDETHTFTIAAFETTALTIIYTLMYLAMYPEYQEKLFEEIQSIYPNSSSIDVNYEDLDRFEYLELVLKESMRLMPAFPIIARELTEDLTLSNGLELPKGLQVAISIYHMHRSRELWGPKAHIYNPENCTPENLMDKHSYAYLPFSKGKRNCIGLKYAMISLKITFIKIIRNYKFRTSFRTKDMEIENNMSLRLKTMPSFELERRV